MNTQKHWNEISTNIRKYRHNACNFTFASTANARNSLMECHIYKEWQAYLTLCRLENKDGIWDVWSEILIQIDHLVQAHKKFRIFFQQFWVVLTTWIGRIQENTSWKSVFFLSTKCLVNFLIHMRFTNDLTIQPPIRSHPKAILIITCIYLFECHRGKNLDNYEVVSNKGLLLQSSKEPCMMRQKREKYTKTFSASTAVILSLTYA